jgi:hypothetical protein
MKIHVSISTKLLLEKTNKFKIVERGTVQVKGKGEMKTYFVECKLDDDGKPIELAFMHAYEDYELVQEDDKYDKKGAGFKLIGESNSDEINKNQKKAEDDLSKNEIQNKPNSNANEGM